MFSVSSLCKLISVFVNAGTYTVYLYIKANRVIILLQEGSFQCQFLAWQVP